MRKGKCCDASCARARADRCVHYKGLISKLLMMVFLWHPKIPGALKLDSIQFVFKSAVVTSTFLFFVLQR